MNGAASRLRIALVLGRFDRGIGGLESWTHDLAAALLARGHEVHVFAASVDAGDLPVLAHPVLRDGPPRQLAESVAAALSGQHFDIVHDMGIGWSADVFHPQAGSRVLNLDREVAAMKRPGRLRLAISPRFRRRRRELHAAELLQMNAARAIIAVSQAIAVDIAQRYDVPEERITVVPNRVDTDRFSPMIRAGMRARARRSLGLGEQPAFLAVAHNFRLKGIDTAIAALARLRAEGTAARLIVAGGGDIAGYRALAASCGIADAVDFRGRVAPIEPLYAAADAFVHSTRHDACSLATLEALACGLPVITTRRNGAAEIMRDGIDGIVLEREGDIAALAHSMQALCDPDRRHVLGSAARRLALANPLAGNWAAIEAVYRSLLDGSRAVAA